MLIYKPRTVSDIPEGAVLPPVDQLICERRRVMIDDQRPITAAG